MGAAEAYNQAGEAEDVEKEGQAWLEERDKDFVGVRVAQDEGNLRSGAGVHEVVR